MAAISCRSASTTCVGRPPSRAVASMLIHLGEDGAQLGVRLDAGALAQLRPFPIAQRVVAQLARLVEEDAHLVLVAVEQLADGVAHGLALRRVTPQDVLEERHIVVVHGVAALEPGMRAQHAERLRPAAVRRHHAAAPELAPQVGNGAEHGAWHVERRHIGAGRGELVERQRRADLRRLRLQELQEAEVLADVVDDEAQQEAVVERQQLVVLGQLVGGAERA